jgi:exosortase A
MSVSAPHRDDLAGRTTDAGTPGAGAAPLRRWMVPACCVVVGTLALGALFPIEIAGAWRVWTGSTAFSHCFLVLPLALYLIWDRRERLHDITPRPALWALPALPLLSIAWLFAAILGVLELQQVILVTMVESLLLILLGPLVFRRLLGPFLYLYLLVPTGEFLVPSLQDFTARFVVGALHFAGVPVFSDGILIQIPEGDFMVAEACAGLRFLIASIAFGIFFALVVYRGRGRRLAFIAISLIVPIAANGVRAFGIVYLAHLTNDVTAVEADHVIYGWGFFAAVMAILIAIGLRFSDHGRAVAHATLPPRSPTKTGMTIVATLLALVAAAVGPAYAAFLEAPGARPGLSDAAAPAVAPPWQRSEAAAEDWRPILVTPDREFRDAWTADGRDVQRYIALYVTAGRHNNLVRSQNRIADEEHWGRADVGRVHVMVGGADAVMNSATLTAGSHRLLVWYAYVIDGRVTASALDAKLRQARAILSGQRTASAFLAMATEASSDADRAAATLRDFAAATALPEAAPAAGPPP